MNLRLEKLFHLVADQPIASRARYFAEHGVSTEMQREVEELLAFDFTSDASLESHIVDATRRVLAAVRPEQLQCGAYRLGEPVGTGGMGAVYSAERVDGELSQRVAIKFLRAGADVPLMRQRFLAERQILATLSHPNIARLLDAGHRPDGQPYLVMEYVDGQPLDVCSAALPLRRRLMLFLKVCGAVSYLHRNLIIHRDLKPANILVTTDGEPKLLDFGIAKLLDLHTDHAVTSSTRILTPDFASPEQLAGEPLTIATDIYSLGAVLYRMLTGSSPHQSDVHSAAYPVTQCAITPPSRLVPEVKGDLEAIVLKALRPEPESRYASVEQFAHDLENFLACRPVRARRNDASYRIGKFLRRYWFAVGTAALAVTGLCAGLLVANHERVLAQRRFNQVRELANKLFDIDAEVRRSPGTAQARELIVAASLDYLRRVSADAQDDPGLALDLATAYMRVARVQGVPIGANLGRMREAGENLRIAQRFIARVLKSQPDNRTAFVRQAQILHDRMLLARLDGSDMKALALARDAAQCLDRLRAGPQDAIESRAILNTYLNVADQHLLGRCYEDALRLCRQGRELARIFSSPPYAGSFLWVSALVARDRADLDEALRQIHESAWILDPGSARSEAGRMMNLVLALIYEARILGEPNSISLGRTAEAQSILKRAFDISDSFVHQDAHDQNSRGRLAMAGLQLAGILQSADPRRALSTYDHVLRHMAEISDNSSFRRFEASALAGSAYPLRRLGRTNEARRRLDEALARLRLVHDYPAEVVKPGSEIDVTLSAMADYQAGRGHVAEALGNYQDLLALVQAWHPQPQSDLRDLVQLSRLDSAISALERRAGNTQQAIARVSGIAALWREWDVRLPGNPFIHRNLNRYAPHRNAPAPAGWR